VDVASGLHCDGVADLLDREGRGDGHGDPVGELTGDPLHVVVDLVTTRLAAGSQFRCDPVCPLCRSAGAVPQPGSDRPACVVDPLTGGADPADRLNQQTRVVG
jgi:hypothetical protein